MALLYTDEHVPLAVIRALQRAGHDVTRAREIFPEGTSDDTHFERVIRDRRVLLTQDTDFLVLSARSLAAGVHHPGVVYWPQGVYTIGQVVRRLTQYLETTTPESRQDLVKFLQIRVVQSRASKRIASRYCTRTPQNSATPVHVLGGMRYVDRDAIKAHRVGRQ